MSAAECDAERTLFEMSIQDAIDSAESPLAKKYLEWAAKLERNYRTTSGGSD